MTTRPLKAVTAVCAVAFALCACSSNVESVPNTLRAPAYPLVSIDPYTSAWSPCDHLYDAPVQHWTGKEFPLIGALSVDGQVYRFLGAEDGPYTSVLSLAKTAPWTARFTTSEPKGDWQKPDYDDSRWQEGPGGFSTGASANFPAAWDGRDIWVRRSFDLEDEPEGIWYLLSSSDRTAEFYLNGVLVRRDSRSRTDLMTQLPAEAAAALKKGRNTISAKCSGADGQGHLDLGLVFRKPAEEVFGTTAVQKYADVQPTRTIYGFDCGPVSLTLSFMAPLLLDNLDLLSRPVNYVTYDVASADGRKHDVKIYFEASPLWAVDFPVQETRSEAFTKGGLTYLKAGTLSQDILAKKGDDVRIDWGYFYLASETAGTVTGIGEGDALRRAFVSDGTLSGAGTSGDNGTGRMAVVRDLGSSSKASGKVMIGYDDIYSIQYFGENLRAWWNADGTKTIEDAFEAACREYPSLEKKCRQFDAQMMADALRAGGREYAELCALAYRQSIHAHKLVKSSDGELHWLSKENNSNGSIGTVDITYPSAPLFLLYNTELAKGLMNHIYYYSESGRWTKPFPSHDVGTYPLANGQTYGGDMPVEEAGNMLILTAAVCHYDKDASYARKHWETLTTWTEYLSQFGLDPDTQLCTDDFAGRLAHNINLSVKAILGIASYGYMAGMLGEQETCEKYTARAREMAAKWVEMADDGDHYRLTFDRPGTWSQKYNLVWDKMLGLNIFPDDVAKKELAYYPKVSNRYGLPLDNRATYTKTDWIVWTATLSEDQEEFQSFIKPVHTFMNETTDRVPMSDWVFTDSPTHRGFKARSVVGGYFIKMLKDRKD